MKNGFRDTRGALIIPILMFIGVVIFASVVFYLTIRKYEKTAPIDQSQNQSRIEAGSSPITTTTEIKSAKSSTSSTQMQTFIVDLRIPPKSKQKSPSSTVRTAETKTPSGILCNGTYWSICPDSYRFNCSPQNGGECIPVGTTLCNGKYWNSCPQGQEFNCPATGPAQCIENVASGVNSEINPREIKAKSLVALLCHYQSKNTASTSQYTANNGEVLKKGSGVIVSPDGYILTARHLIDPQWTNLAYAATTPDWEKNLNGNIDFNYCEVGPPSSDNLPTAADIKTINPQLNLSEPFPYVAKIYFEPTKANLSDSEYQGLDFAVLKITGPIRDCASFNLCNLPSSYDYDPVLYKDLPQRGEELISFGYPSEAINSTGGAFTNFFLKGAVGPFIDYYGGDQYFKDNPFFFDFSANDVLRGRSGSPVFWKGYLVGLIYGTSIGNVTDVSVLGMPAIYQILKDNNLDNIVLTK